MNADPRFPPGPDDDDQQQRPTGRQVVIPPSVKELATPADRIFGAQKVAVSRDESAVLQKIRQLAAAAGSDWYYRWPVKKKGGGQDWIEGPSIKLANDVARIYGNVDIDVRVIDLGDSWLFYARILDLETGFSLTRPYQQRKSQKSIKTDDEQRSLDIAFQIGASKAIRNVITNGLQTYSEFAVDEAKQSIVDKIEGKLPEWISRVVEGLGREKVDVKRVERVIGRASQDWLAPDVAKVVAVMQAVADGMTSWADAFPTDAPVQNPLSDAAPVAGEGEAGEQVDDNQQQADPKDKKPAAPPKDKAAPKDKAPKAPAAPKDEASYVAHAEGWIFAATSVTALEDQWKSERDLRASCAIGEDALLRLKRAVDDRAAELKKKR